MTAAKVAGEAARSAPIDVRFIGDLPGCYVLSSREGAGADAIKVFGCRSRSISVDMAVLQAPVQGAVGENIALKLDDLGLLRAIITRHTSDGFVVDLVVPEDERAALAARIDWMKRRHLHDIPDRRESRRWMPRNPVSSLILAGGKQLDCFIIDVSTTGAAISADAMPPLGQPLAVGVMLCVVVRHLEFGFAVQFLSPQDAQKVEQLLSPPQQERSRLLAKTVNSAEAVVASPHPGATRRAANAQQLPGSH